MLLQKADLIVLGDSKPPPLDFRPIVAGADLLEAPICWVGLFL
jgi:hypothetical protein